MTPTVFAELMLHVVLHVIPEPADRVGHFLQTDGQWMEGIDFSNCRVEDVVERLEALEASLPTLAAGCEVAAEANKERRRLLQIRDTHAWVR